MASVVELFDLALRHHQSRNLAQAESLYHQILQVEPAHVEARHLLGALAHQTGRHEVAISLIRGAIALCPTVPLFHTNLGLVLRQQGHHAEAVLCFREALRLDPSYVDALENLGNVFRDQGNAAEAAQCFRQVLALNPGHAQAHNNLGVALQDQGRLAEAIECFRQALKFDPQFTMALNNLGSTLLDQGQVDEAVRCFREVLRLDPNDANAHNNLGVALKEIGQFEEALACHERALYLQPDSTCAHWIHASARWNLSLLRLLKGDFREAWPDFEYQWLIFGAVPRHVDRPRWDGSSLEGKTILLHPEQGLGDTLHFIRYAPMVKDRGGTVLFECQPPLLRLLEGVAGIDQLIARGAPLPHFDVQAPLMSLPGLFGTTLATIPAAIPYVNACPTLVLEWRKELPPGFKIGIAWQGNPEHAGDRRRSVPLRYFESLARLQGVRLVSLQKGPGTDQLPQWIGNPSQVFSVLDLHNRLETFADTAAVMMNLDLIVTVDTAVAHLAGALGVPAWVLLPFAPDWRWLLERSDSPWYPTLRLFRQSRRGDWGEVFDRLVAQIIVSHEES
jgi:tetratricopeptide (TPR) repeat protein